MTHLTTATNHGQEVKDRIPVRPELFQAPFLARPDLPVPDLVLTKSHCSGFCLHCSPASVGTFQESCLTASWSDHRFHKRWYRLGIVKKAVHLVRDPIDNAVSRLHHALHTHERLGLSNATLHRLSNTETSLSAWCEYVDDEFRSLIPPVIAQRPDIDRLQAIPCYSEFIRQVLWHNAALNMTHRVGLPVLTMFYENYTSNFDGATRELYSFLDQPIVGRPAPFVAGKSYHHLFHQNHVLEIEYLMRSLASSDSWELLRHYFEKPSSTLVLAEPVQSTDQRQRGMESLFASDSASQESRNSAGLLRSGNQATETNTRDGHGSSIQPKRRNLRTSTDPDATAPTGQQLRATSEVSKVAWLLSFPNSVSSP